MPVPAEMLAPHEVLIADSAFGVDLPDGLPMPFLLVTIPAEKPLPAALWRLRNIYLPLF